MVSAELKPRLRELFARARYVVQEDVTLPSPVPGQTGPFADAFAALTKTRANVLVFCKTAAPVTAGEVAMMAEMAQKRRANVVLIPLAGLEDRVELPEGETSFAVWDRAQLLALGRRLAYPLDKFV